MRVLHLVVAFLALLIADAHAGDDTEAAQRVADKVAVCAKLRAALNVGPDSSSCERVGRRLVRGLGVVEVWSAGTHGYGEWVLLIDTGHELWLSPFVPVSGSDCGAGTCVDVEVRHALRPVRRGGRAAVALSLRIKETWHRNEGRGPRHSSTQSSILTCWIPGRKEVRCASWPPHAEEEPSSGW